MTSFRKIVRLGTASTAGGRRYSIFCKIEYRDGHLSISGVEGPTDKGITIGGFGQIDMHLRDAQDTIALAPGWTPDMLSRFFDIWRDWHLNDMRAGSPAQMAELAKHDFKTEDGRDYYKWALRTLEAAGLQPDPSYMHEGKPYSYGSAWLSSTVPEEALAFLRALPDTDRTPAWV